jgi:predicted RNase H-like HicB family nuclease
MEIPIKVVIHRDEDGMFWAEVPGLPGCATEGKTLDDLKANLQEAIEGCFGVTQDESLRQGGREPGEVLTL